MKPALKALSELIAKANDRFYAKHPKVLTVMGIMDKALRNQGVAADAITLDCSALDRKIVFLLPDSSPDRFTVAIGNKAGDIHSSSEYDRPELTASQIVSLLETHLLSDNA